MALISKLYNSDIRRVLAWSRKGKTKKECEKIIIEEIREIGSTI